MIIGTDMDGVLTTSPIHCGGLGAVGKIVWGFLRATRLADRIMRRAQPRAWVCAAARKLHEVGHEVRVITAREERYRLLTQEWLRKNEVHYHHLIMRPRGLDTISFKVAAVAACDVYWEDQQEIIDELKARGCPARLYNTTKHADAICAMAGV